VLFAEGSAALSGDAHKVITAAAGQIKTSHPAAVTITGYTDKIAGQPLNDKLSQQRAQNVLAALKSAVGPGATTYAARPKVRPTRSPAMTPRRAASRTGAPPSPPPDPPSHPSTPARPTSGRTA